ncbi:MAG: hypothetical protein L0220_07905 [Acidobacteria bacterium]|nr:hypothetical protein [Acidobacteriota bacterium]
MQKYFLFLILVLIVQLPAEVADLIRAAALSTSEHPLPLAAHWNLGQSSDGFSPAYQMKMIEQGHFLLPSFLMPEINADPNDPHWLKYYEDPIKRAAQLKLPISLVGTQWERLLSEDNDFLKLPANQNPNVVTADGQIKPEVSPFGPAATWREVGVRWGSSRIIRKLQEWYPNPPLVIFLSNNEHTKLPWTRAEEDSRFKKLFGSGRDDDFKRKVVGDGWIERYRSLQRGIRESLTSNAWKENAIFIAYDAFGPSHFARWPGWMEHSLYSSGRIDPWPLAWDGGSPSFYTFNWSTITDYTVYSPQIEAMNWVFMQAEAKKLNPKFWFEVSTWDGHEPTLENDKRKTYEKSGQQFTPERYGGMVQFGMWLLRPRVVREFRGYLDTLAQSESYFLPIVNAVDRVHKKPILRDFWLTADLVPNRAQQHPYRTMVPQEFQTRNRWFLLDTSLDPKRPWQAGTPLPVYALALIKGNAPQRKWLLYAHSPLGPRQNVQISIPGYRAVTVNVSVGGSFYSVDEASRKTEEIN